MARLEFNSSIPDCDYDHDFATAEYVCVPQEIWQVIKNKPLVDNPFGLNLVAWHGFKAMLESALRGEVLFLNKYGCILARGFLK